MSYVKRQELFKDLNPLLKKYKYDGPQPPSYIPPKKRKMITRYMGRSSFSPGYFVPGDEEPGLVSSKMAAEKKNQKDADYDDAVKERIEDGAAVKQFQNEQRIHYGRLDADEPKQRRRGLSGVTPIESYDKLVEQRDAIKVSTNKVNCFTNENEPAFINSMSRTMDAFDTRMSTFGGRHADQATKKKNFDKFIAEKRGFIRTTNQFYNQDPYTIIRQEKPKIVEKPGPALGVNYDNKYKAHTSFATDAGRVKQELNVNRGDEAALKGAEKTEMMGALRFSNIKFDLDEKGADEFKARDRELDEARLSARRRKLPMQAIGEVRESVEQRADAGEAVFNAGKFTVAAPRLADYESGEALRSRTGQRVRHEDFARSGGGSDTEASLPAKEKWAASPFALKQAYSVKAGAGHRPYPSQIADGLRPYELWKKQMVTKSGSVTLGKNRDIKLTYDQSSKAHLTSVKGAPNKADYTPVARVYHGKRLSVDPAHIDIDEGIHKVMKTTTYSIGKKGEDAPNEVNTTNQTHLTQKVHKGEDPPKVDKNSRRCDPENPNRAKAVGFGFGSEKGTYEHQVIHRSKTFYGDVYNQQKVPHMYPGLTKQINDSRKEFQLVNKFEYGYDEQGGARANAPLDADDPSKIKACLKASAKGHQQREEFKENIERQNFTIQHDKELSNTDTKYIGTHKGKGIDNIIDQDDLKRSHVPIPSSQKDKLKILKSFYGSTNVSPGLTRTRDHVLAVQKEYTAFKTGSEESKVPFSNTRRNRLERTYDKFDKLNGYGASTNKATFGWKVPTYDLQ